MKKAITIPNGIMVVKSCTQSIFSKDVTNLILTVVFNIDYSSGRINKVYADFDDIQIKIKDTKDTENAIELSMGIYTEFKQYLREHNGKCPIDIRRMAGIENFESTSRKFANLKELSDELEISEEILRSKQN